MIQNGFLSPYGIVWVRLTRKEGIVDLSELVKEKLSIQSMDDYIALFGMNDQFAAQVEQECGVTMGLHGDELTVAGEADRAALAVKVIDKLLKMIHRREPVDSARIRYAVALAKDGKADLIDEMLRSVVAITHRGRQIRCKTYGQQQYVEAIRTHDLTFAEGPAGTGKTYLAMALAVQALKSKEVERLILTRPAVEAGEKLGFLPGDLTQKVDPYLRPLYDALYDFMGAESYQKLMERGTVEVAPLAYMRGRTLSNAFIILDEAQNTTSEQMKMFLTRMGMGSKMVITGDVTQIDLPIGKKSGLVEALEVLRGVEDIGIVTLTHRDVVRHELVQAIVKAYEKAAKRTEERRFRPVRQG